MTGRPLIGQSGVLAHGGCGRICCRQLGISLTGRSYASPLSGLALLLIGLICPGLCRSIRLILAGIRPVRLALSVALICSQHLLEAQLFADLGLPLYQLL